MALMQGGAGISLDLPPFCVAAGDNRICGLNAVGLRRAGMAGEERLELRRVYRSLFQRTVRLSEALERMENEVRHAAGRQLLEFVRASKRGICSHGRHRASD
jgi:UDP-N-acetylglucosamine acyltransferase